MISHDADEGMIQGIQIEETGEQYTHSQFVDDTSVVVEARRDYVD